MDPLRKSTDRGATPYFHGRTPILDSFKNRLRDDKKNNEGTTFLVQGPPGIGKTALLDECRKKAKREKWEVRKLVVTALWDPDLMAECLGLKKKEVATEKTTGGGGKLQYFGASLEGGLSRTTKKATPKVTPRSLIQKIKDPLLLILDEAQRMGESSNINGPYKDEVSDLLTEIHNGELGKPVILLAGGLGLTEDAFRALGISRMAEDCMFDMEPLEKEEERTVIQNWLKKAGGATGDVTHWIDTITTETYRWPRHVDSYARNAARLIKDNHGQMTEDLLRSVMETGREKRWAYYTGRTEGLDDDHIVRLVEMFRDTPVEEGFRKQDLVAELGEPGFAQVVSKGVLYYSNPLYTLPIPSLYDYLTERATRIREAALRYERVKKQRQASRHLTRDVSGQQPESKDQSEAEGSQKETGNHTPDSPSPEKEEGKEPTIRKSEKDNSRREPLQSKETSNRKQDTDRGMER